MPDVRIIFAGSYLADALHHPFTIQQNDQTFGGVWSKPDQPVLIFSDNYLDGGLYHHGGPMAGAPGGHPLQLIFWGDWWNGPGATKCGLVESRTKALLESVYFSELTQYGVAHAPIWRGSIVATRPAPPTAVDDSDDIMSRVLSLIEDLIEDDVFPDPDDGPRIIFIVLLPDTLTLSAGFPASGAHSNEYDIGFPLYDDSFWGGWIAPGLPVDPLMGSDRSLMKTLSHEVVETLTDPECTAWCTDSPDDGRFEISDAGVSGAPGSLVTQTAFVNGVHVQSYWSAKHRATVIPLDRDYQARLTARTREVRRHIVASGVFRPDPADNAACSPQLPECCIDDRDYEWRVYSVEEVARIHLITQRYRRKDVVWTINGHTFGDAPEVTVTLDVETFAGRTASVEQRTVTLHCTATNNGLDIRSSGGNFQITVGCAVRETDITGSVMRDGGGMVATPEIAIGFDGSQVLLEDAYIKQKTACWVAMLRRYDVQYKPSTRIRPEEGINWDSSILLRDLPAYVRPTQYAGMRWLARVGMAAHRLLEPDTARSITDNLVAEAASLSLNLDVASLKAEVRAARSSRTDSQRAVRHGDSANK